MPEFTLIDALLWLVALIGTFWAVIPPVLSHLGWTLLRFTADDSPGGSDPTGDDPDAERLYRQLGDLGFRPAGTVTELAWFLQHEWHKEFHIRMLATPDGRTFAGLYRLDDAEGVRLALYTPVAGDGLVTTVTPGAGAQHIDDQFLRTEVPGVGPAELLARHREHVEHFTREKGLDVERDTLAGLAARSEEHDRRQQRTMSQHGVLQFLGVCFGVPSMMGLLAWQAFGSNADALRWAAASLCFGTVVYALVTKAVIPYLFRLQLLSDNPPPE
jgi:hypothetical protein